ncbi:hypothetical protein BDM02DRAFT_3181387 [Thelephora ganbajun]|uniref:Uncharacterized protein n=1 Tax=Thelephora ganbajun TaxID=370292 RepID=A0ACB6Z5U4_THEGA|nr:hypothetical protein BDM02DRAFT_3181387 [Thelephora ganbajun]
MPKSKRAKVVPLTKVAKRRGNRRKAQANVDKWKYCWLFGVGNMRNGHLKTTRKVWEERTPCSAGLFSGFDRTFLGRGAEHLLGLHRLSQHIKGQVGLFFTDSPPDEATTWFDDFHLPDFARAAIRVPKAVIISIGAVTQHHSDPPEAAPHNKEPQLRKLGLTTRTRRGVPTLGIPHKICEQGKKLTPEQSQLVKLLGYKRVEFKTKLLGRWEKEARDVTVESATEVESQANDGDDEGEGDGEDMSD